MIKLFIIPLSFLFQLALLLSSFWICSYYYADTGSNEKLQFHGLFILIIVWFIIAWLTHKYKPQYYQGKWKYIIAPFINAVFFQLIFIFLIGLVIKMEGNDFRIIFESTVLYLSAEFIVYSLIILFRGKANRKDEWMNSDVKKYVQDDLEPVLLNKPRIDFSNPRVRTELFSENIITELYKKESPSDFENSGDIKIIKSGNDLRKESFNYHVCILDKRINDLTDINRSLIAVYHLLNPGGYLLIAYKELTDFEQEYLMSETGSMKFIKTVHYYLYYRAIPKIPYINALYRFSSGGRNKVISRAETLGRLFYCGFEVEKEVRREGVSYLLARKSKTLSENPDPSFYPVIKLNRVSINGVIIKIHKIRSMYPYSEFIQKKVFEEADMTSSGKFGNDFRITKFGRICRKYWLDEIPQFIDLFRGTIKLVGIRAMSQHYFSLYPQEYKDAYYRVKPGIISPIFDENTAGFEDIVRIEKEYLDSYIKNPFRTDIKYFFITIRHMLGGVRGS